MTDYFWGFLGFVFMVCLIYVGYGVCSLLEVIGSLFSGESLENILKDSPEEETTEEKETDK